MAEGGTIRFKLKADTAKFKADMKGVTNQLSGLGGKISGAVGPMTALTVAVSAMGVAIAKSVGKFADFEAGLDRVGAITGIERGSEQLEALEKQARSLGATTKFTAVQVSEAYNFMAMAGMDANTIMEATPSVLQLAAAGALDLGDAANIVTNIMAGFGQEASELAKTNDILTAAITGANVDVRQMGEAFKVAGPVAKAAGISFEDTATAIALMGNAGIQGSLAGTSLRGAISNLLSPSKKAAGIMKQLGVNVKDAQGNLIPFGDILKEFKKSGIQAGDAMEVFGLRAGPGMLALLEQGTGAFDKFNKRLSESDGLAQSVAERGMSTLEGKTVALGSAFEGLQITIGKSFKPAAEVVVVALSSMTNAIDDYITKSNGWIGLVKEIAKDLLRLLTPLGAIEGLVLSILGLTKGDTGSKRFRMDLEAASKSTKETDKAIQNLMRPETTGKISKGVKNAIEDGAKDAKPEIDFSEMAFRLTDAMMEASDKGLKEFQKGLSKLGKIAGPKGPGKSIMTTSRGGTDLQLAEKEAAERFRQMMKDATAHTEQAITDFVEALFALGGKMAPTFAALFKDIKAGIDGAGWDFTATFASIGIVALQNSEAMRRLTDMFNKVAEALGKFLDAIIFGVGDMFSSVGKWFSGLGGAFRETEEGIGTMAKTIQSAIRSINSIIADLTLDKAIEETLLGGDVSGLTQEQKEQLRGRGEKMIEDLNEEIAKIDWGIIEGDAGALREQRDKIQNAVDGIAEPLAAGGESLRKTVSDLNEATAGVPSGVKVALARFNAAEAFTGSPAQSAIMPASNTGAAPSNAIAGQTNMIVENMILQTDDPDEMFRKLENQYNMKTRASGGALSRVNQSSLNAFGMM